MSKATFQRPVTSTLAAIGNTYAIGELPVSLPKQRASHLNRFFIPEPGLQKTEK